MPIEPKELRIVAYCRVSTNDKHQTTANQLQVIEEYRLRKGWPQPIYFEEYVSATATRPIKYDIMRMCRNKEFDVLVVAALDRFGRQTRDLLNDINELDSLGVKFVSVREQIDLSSPTGQLQLAVISAFAQFEHDLIASRVKEGMKRARSEGKHIGRPKGSFDKKPRRRSGYYNRYKPKKSPPFLFSAILPARPDMVG